MKKLINFLKRSTFIAAICLAVTGTFVPTEIEMNDEASYGTYGLTKPAPDERPVGADGVEHD